jgi:hypothetical protein
LAAIKPRLAFNCKLATLPTKQQTAKKFIMKAETQKPPPFDQLPAELRSMVFDNLDLNAALEFSRTSKGNFAAITNDPGSVAIHYGQTLKYLGDVDPKLQAQVLLGLSKGLPTLFPKLSAAQEVGVFHALSATMLAVGDESLRAMVITGVASGLKEVADAQARLKFFDRLKDAALDFENEGYRAEACGGVAAALGAVPDAEARSVRLAPLMARALDYIEALYEIEDADEGFEHAQGCGAKAIAGVAKGLGAVPDENARLLDFRKFEFSASLFAVEHLIVAIGGFTEGLGAVADANARLSIFDKLMDGALDEMFVGEQSRCSAIVGLAKGLGALENAQVRLDRFVRLNDAALAIEDESCRAEAIGGVGASLGVFPNEKYRLDRFARLKDAALAIQDKWARAVAIGGLAASFWAVADTEARLKSFDQLKDAALFMPKNVHSRAIPGLAKGLGALEDAQDRLIRFDQLKDAALVINDQRFLAEAIGGLAKGLGALEDAQDRLVRFDQLKNAARGISDKHSLTYAIGLTAMDLSALEPQHRLACALALKTGDNVSEIRNPIEQRVRELRAKILPKDVYGGIKR